MTDTNERSGAPRVAVVMGSSSDWPTMSKAVEVLERLGVAHHAQVLSAHRMPDEMFAFADAAHHAGFRAIIAGAGGGAHLPGMLAAKTTVPGLGVPAGTPVATFAIGEAGATNAALYPVALLAADAPDLHARLVADRRRRHDEAAGSVLPPAT